MEKNPVIQDDILRYKKNKLSALLAILGLVFSVLYFMIVYALNSLSFYTIYIGLSVIVTLLILLISFYSSESIKNYKKAFCIVLLVLAVVEVVRIFYFPMQVIDWPEENLLADKMRDAAPFNGAEKKYVLFYFTVGLTPAACSTVMIIYLVASAVCFVGAAVTGYLTATRLEKHVKAIESGELKIDEILAETDAFAIDNDAPAVEKEVE